MWNHGKTDTDASVGKFQQRLRDRQLASVFDPTYQAPAPEGPKAYDQPIQDFLDGKWGSRLQPLLESHVFGMENAERGAAQWVRELVNNTGPWPAECQTRHFLQGLTLLHEKKSAELTQPQVDALRNGGKILAALAASMQSAGITPGKLPAVLDQSSKQRKGKAFVLESVAGQVYDEQVWPSIRDALRSMSPPSTNPSYVL